MEQAAPESRRGLFVLCGGGESEAAHVPPRPPEEDEGKVGIDVQWAVYLAVEGGSLSPEHLGAEEREEQGEGEDEQGILPQGAGEVAVEQAVDGPLRAAARAFPSRQRPEGALREESRRGGVVQIVDRPGGQGQAEEQDRLPHGSEFACACGVSYPDQVDDTAAKADPEAYLRPFPGLPAGVFRLVVFPFGEERTDFCGVHDAYDPEGEAAEDSDQDGLGQPCFRTRGCFHIDEF